VIKYTKDIIQSAVDKSTSITDVIFHLGKKTSGGLHGHIKHLIKKFEIDTTHFGKTTCQKNVVGSRKKSFSEILVKSNRRHRADSGLLTRALIESGRTYICETCDLSPMWNDISLNFEIHHINGDWSDNHSGNLKFLCPNCHSQTDNYGVRKIIKSELVKECKHCEKEFVTKNQSILFCSCKCANSRRRINSEKIIWPSNEELTFMVEHSNFTQVAKELGVSDNAIRKRLNRSCG